MISSTTDVSDGSTLAADVCITGAGAAGITIARDLRSTGLDVVMIEGGPLDRSGSSNGEENSLYEGNTTGLPIDVAGSRVRAFGGSTNHWSGMCAPLEPEDFTEDGFPDGRGWPIDYEEMIPYYRRAQETCELGRYEYDPTAIADREGKPVVDFEESAARNILYQFSEPTRFGDVYREDLEQSGQI